MFSNKPIIQASGKALRNTLQKILILRPNQYVAGLPGIHKQVGNPTFDKQNLVLVFIETKKLENCSC
jgi:hypothetical protein